MSGIRRRDFMSLLGGAAAVGPLPARAQQPAAPVIGIINAGSPDSRLDRMRACRQGLKGAGHVEGETVTIESRQHQGMERELVEQRVEAVLIEFEEAH